MNTAQRLELKWVTLTSICISLHLKIYFLFQIFSRGGIPIQSQKFNCGGQKCLSNNIQVKPQFFPLSSIVVYYITDDSEILFDEIIVDVKHFHLSHVSFTV